ncbi:MAG: hypothetical protein H6530_02750 [Nocardioidaceae bacterium]|nr:hypothetical protein [Nocardioidaceae bacterium]
MFVRRFVAALGLALLLVGSAGASALAEESPLDVLHDWDAARQAAYQAGDASKLTDLYVTGSSAAAQDVALLEAYSERGLRVISLRQQFFSVEVLAVSTVSIQLRTVERFAGGLAFGEGGCQRIPSGFPEKRAVTMTYDGTRWRVDSVSR